jgi:hypothetical protein
MLDAHTCNKKAKSGFRLSYALIQTPYISILLPGFQILRIASRCPGEKDL